MDTNGFHRMKEEGQIYLVGYAYYVVDGVGLVVVRYVHTEKA